MSVKTDVKAACSLVLNSHDRYARYSKPFVFTTENQLGLDGILHYKDKEILMPASSGDQYLAAKYFGAKSVDLYDINRLTKYMIHLKIAAIRCLSYEEFLSFFLPFKDVDINPRFFDRSVLKRISKDLPDDSAEFWNKISRLAKLFGMDKLVRMNTPVNYFDVVKRGMPFYANPVAYYELQNKLCSHDYTYPKFFEADVLVLSDVIVDEYDIVYLSNILGVLSSVKFDKAISKDDIANQIDFKQREVLKQISPHLHKLLRENGIVLMNYASICRINDLKSHLFTNNHFEAWEIPAKVSSEYVLSSVPIETDVALTFTPSKRGWYC